MTPLIPLPRRAFTSDLASMLPVFASLGITFAADLGPAERSAVWLTDPSDANRHAFDGTIRLYDGSDLIAEADTPSTLADAHGIRVRLK